MKKKGMKKGKNLEDSIQNCIQISSPVTTNIVEVQPLKFNVLFAN